MRIVQTIPTRDPVLDQMDEFLTFILVTEMAAVLKNGQGTLGKPLVQSFCITGCQESVLVTPKQANRHIECIQMRIYSVGAFRLMLEPSGNLTDPPDIGRNDVRDLLVMQLPKAALVSFTT